MKKIFLSLILVILLSGSALGVSSDDVYLRKDVFDAKMDAFMSEIRLMNEQNRREMDKRFNELDKKIENVKTELHYEIQNVKTELQSEIQVLSSKVDLLDERTESTKTTVYWGLALMGLILASAVVVPPLTEFFKGLRKKEPSFTLEDVKHLIRLEFEELSKPV